MTSEIHPFFLINQIHLPNWWFFFPISCYFPGGWYPKDPSTKITPRWTRAFWSKKAKVWVLLLLLRLGQLSRGHPRWWFSKGNILISGESRLVNYWNLARLQTVIEWQEVSLGGKILHHGVSYMMLLYMHIILFTPTLPSQGQAVHLLVTNFFCWCKNSDGLSTKNSSPGPGSQKDKKKQLKCSPEFFLRGVAVQQMCYNDGN